LVVWPFFEPTTASRYLPSRTVCTLAVRLQLFAHLILGNRLIARYDSAVTTAALNIPNSSRPPPANIHRRSIKLLLFASGFMGDRQAPNAPKPFQLAVVTV
jgi:hypothetical protein